MVFYSKNNGLYFSENITKIFAHNQAVYIALKGENTMDKIKEFESTEEAQVYVGKLASLLGQFSNPNVVIGLDDLKRVDWYLNS